MAIFISCLGLLGLIVHTAEQRVKEFGIRKVLGASVRSIFMLLSKDFVLLVLIAFAISSPFAWYMMK
ncbi:MAG: FtsX-like permease family protein [Bacteroidota bacterium]